MEHSMALPNKDTSLTHISDKRHQFSPLDIPDRWERRFNNIEIFREKALQKFFGINFKIAPYEN